jgi:hypothetical protein
LHKKKHYDSTLSLAYFMNGRGGGALREEEEGKEMKMKWVDIWDARGVGSARRWCGGE